MDDSIAFMLILILMIDDYYSRMVKTLIYLTMLITVKLSHDADEQQETCQQL
jgi:hypothetical protein